MSFDLVDRFNQLSVSSSKSATLNKKPFIIRSDLSEFSAFDTFKYSSRILLNFKNMSIMGLKAGSLVRICIKENIFEVWPSILTKPGDITFGSLNLYPWLSLEVESTTNLLPAISRSNPILVAKNVKITYAKSESSKHTSIILEWLKANFFAAKCKSFVISGKQEIHFSLEVLDSDCYEKIYRFIPNESLFEENLNATEISSSQIGGLEIQFEEICRIANSFLKPDKHFDCHNIRLTRGILLYGPPGCGKTLLVKTISDFVNVPVINLTASDFASGIYGEAELKLKNIFNYAKSSGSCIIFMDEIDSLCPKRELTTNTTSQRITTLLLTLMDGCSGHKSGSKIFFIGATNMPASLDSALRRPGRFDREIEISPPSSSDRYSILKKIISKYPNNLTDNDSKLIADLSHGYVGSDLNLLCKEAFMNSIKASADIFLSPLITINNMQISLSKIRPSAMREVFVEVPKVKWSDIGGQSLTKQKLIECVEWPIKFPERFKKLGINPPKGVLLFGPPGCSKTLLAKALASESGLNFLAVKGPEIFSKYVGESEKRIREIFKKARQASPSIIFFDEFDSIASRSGSGEGTSSVTNRVMSQLLNEMDGLEPLVNVIIIAATNKPDLIDKALLRPGRFDRHIYISLPDYEGRLEMFKILSKRMPFSNEFIPENVAAITEGFSGAEITSLCQNSAIRALELDISSLEIKWIDFEFCFSKFEKQTNTESLRIFEKFIE